MVTKKNEISDLIEHAKSLKRLGALIYHDQYPALLTLTAFLPKTASIKQRIWHVTNNIYSLPSCVVCGNDATWNKLKGGDYRECCSVKCAMLNPKRMKKIKETNLKKYGSESPFGNKKVQEKAKVTVQQKYGVDNISQLDEIKNRKKDTCKRNFGVTVPLKSPIVMETLRNTNLMRYGVENVFQNNAIRDKIKETSWHRYGTEHANQNKEAMVFLLNKEWLTEQHNVHKQTIGQIALGLGVCNDTITTYFKKHKIATITHSRSIAERDIATWIESLGIDIVTNTKKIIGLELDIYIPQYKLAIEYNGLYYHSTAQGKDSNYHLNKTQLCEAQGIRLIHIFEDEWRDQQQKCKDTLLHLMNRSKKGVYARNTTIREINWPTARKFLNQYHLLNAGSCGNKRIGAYDNNDNLIGVMVFGQTNNEHGDSSVVELKRFVTNKKNNPGLGSKMFKHAIRTFGYNEIIAYVDRRWFTGLVKQHIGFVRVGYTKPALWWTDYTNRQHRRFISKKDLVAKGHPAHLSKSKILESIGYDTIWDSGKVKLHWTN